MRYSSGRMNANKTKQLRYDSISNYPKRARVSEGDAQMKAGLSSLIVSHPSPLFLSQPKSTPQVIITKASSSSSPSPALENIEIRVCTNRTCRRQGSLETLQTLSGIAPPNVAVKSCGCLGRCGYGPNVVVLPEASFFGHCGTPSRAFDTMFLVCCGSSCESEESWKIKSGTLEALALRKRAEDEMDKGNFVQAEVLLSQAIDLKPFGGIHIIYKDRSEARLAMHKMVEALEDAKEALTLSPRYPEGYICEGDILMAMDYLEAAEKSFLMALEIDPSIRRSKSFKARVAKLQEEITTAS